MKDLQKLIDEINDSTIFLYPQKRSPLALSNHLQREVVELMQAIESGSEKNIFEEIADCLILVINIATQYKLDANQLSANVKSKLEICKKREFGDPDENGVVEHIK